VSGVPSNTNGITSMMAAAATTAPVVGAGLSPRCCPASQPASLADAPALRSPVRCAALSRLWALQLGDELLRRVWSAACSPPSSSSAPSLGAAQVGVALAAALCGMGLDASGAAPDA
jgi:hypothetical protein